MSRLECGLRKTTYDKALDIQSLTFKKRVELYDALELYKCNETKIYKNKNMMNFVKQERRRLTKKKEFLNNNKDKNIIYVSPNGDDEKRNSSLENPLKSIEFALRIAKKY